jgi:hypothetical protein
MKSLVVLFSLYFTLFVNDQVHVSMYNYPGVDAAGDAEGNTCMSSGANPGSMLKFKKLSCIDTQGTGLEAYSFLMPSDWKFEGGITWNPEQVAMPASNSFRVFNPAGVEEFEGFPNQCYFWSNSPGLLSLNPPGSKYFGSFVVRPVDANTALQEIIKRTRGNLAELKIISKEDLPELVNALGMNNQSQGPVSTEATGSKIRFSYVRNNLPMEEEIYGLVEQVKFRIQSGFGTQQNIWWYIAYVFSFKAKAGELEAHTRVFQTMTSSFRVNRQWQAKYDNVIEYLAQQQIRRTHTIGEFSRLLSSMSDQMREDQLKQYEQRSNVYDKVARQHSDNMLGIERYYDPFEGHEVQLPSGYNHAWCNNLGEYIMTDNPNFNPNVGSNLTWKPMGQNPQ